MSFGVFTIDRPEWVDRPSNRLLDSLLLRCDDNFELQRTALSFMPCPAHTAALKNISELAQRSVSESTNCAFFDFPFGTEVRATSGGPVHFGRVKSIEVGLMREYWKLLGVSLVLRTPVTDNNDEQARILASHRKVFAQLKLSLSVNATIAMSRQTIICPDGELGMSVSNQATITPIDWEDDGRNIRECSLDLHHDTVEALENYSRGVSDREKFMFGWIAVETLLGSGNQRMAWFKKYSPPELHAEFNRLRGPVRQAVMKGDPHQSADNLNHTLLIAIMKAYVQKDEGIRIQMMNELNDDLVKQIAKRGEETAS